MCVAIRVSFTAKHRNSVTARAMQSDREGEVGYGGLMEGEVREGLWRERLGRGRLERR